MAEMIKIHLRLEGQRPLMFDRYAGDNNTQLPVLDRVYRSSDGYMVIPAINIYSMLVSENTKSVCRQFFGKKGKTIALAISGFTTITTFDIPILGKENLPIQWKGEETPGIYVSKHVARLKNGIPNPKERPTLSLPWALDFEMEYIENSDCPLVTLESAFRMGGRLGLGTFRPFFGRYELMEFRYK